MITFQILIVIQIVYPITCQRLTCQNRMRGNVENQISSRPSITLFFNFAEIITGPIRFSLIFIGFFLTSKLTHTQFICIKQLCLFL